MTYDANGNRAARTTTQKECYQHDALGRLIEVKTAAASCASPTKTITYRYDYSGRRVLKVPASEDGGPLRVFSQYAESQDGVLTKHYFMGSQRIASEIKSVAGFSEIPPGMQIPWEPIRLPPKAENDALVQAGTAVPDSEHLKANAVDMINRLDPYPKDVNHPYYLDMERAAHLYNLEWGGYVPPFKNFDPTHWELYRP